MTGSMGRWSAPGLCALVGYSLTDKARPVLGLPPLVIVAIGTGVLAGLAHRRVFGVNRRTETSWLDAWLKAIVIVVFVVFFTVYLPSYVLQTSTVAEFDRIAQDLIGAAVWGAGFVATIWGLWYAHTQRRV
jgi:uncharacterized membrane-anchored protein